MSEQFQELFWVVRYRKLKSNCGGRRNIHVRCGDSHNAAEFIKMQKTYFNLDTAQTSYEYYLS
jgi:hypothetical protein